MSNRKNFEFDEEKVVNNLKAGMCSICGEVELSKCDSIFGVCDKCMRESVIPPIAGGLLYSTYKQFKKINKSIKNKLIKDTDTEKVKTINNEKPVLFDKKKTKITIFENSNSSFIDRKPVTKDDVLNVKIALNTTPDVNEFINII